MKKENIVCLAAIRRELQARYRYETREKRNWAFKTLFLGWRQKGIRHGRKGPFFTFLWKRGWVAQKDAGDLREYIGLS